MDSLVLIPVSDGFVEWSDTRGITSPRWILPVGDRVVVFTHRPIRVWVLDSTGREVTAFGREGEGPHEFRQFTWAQIQEDSLISIFDRGNGRLTTWTLEGELVRSLPESRGPLVGSAIALTADGHVVRPAPGTDSVLLDLSDRDGFPVQLRRTQETSGPFLIDLLTASGELVAVFENAAGRLVLLDPELRSVRSEVWLPEFVRDRIDEFRAAASEARSPGAILPQYARSMTFTADGRSVVILLAGPRRDGIIGARVERDGDLTLIAIDPGADPDASRLDRQATTLAALGQCYLLGTAMGVRRFCP